MIRSIVTAFFAALVSFLPVAAAGQGADRVTVFAAASLTDALQEIGTAYGREKGTRVVFSFAASMTLARQIELSTGPDLFIAADTESMDYRDQRNRIAKTSRRNLLANRLVLVAPANSNVALTIAPQMKLADALRGGRLAMANVDSVPAGRYGKAALTALGVWTSVADRLAQGEDVRAALAYVARGEAPLGIVYATDARVEQRVRVVGAFPENTHPPVVYPAALTPEASREAAQFFMYLRGPQARAVFERFGFTVLGQQQ
jgi:molybdate transport system substrate-binding protein